METIEFKELFIIYWVVIIPFIFSIAQIYGWQPFKVYRELGLMNNIYKKVGVYLVVVPFNVIGFIGGLSFVNMFVQGLVLIIVTIFGLEPSI